MEPMTMMAGAAALGGLVQLYNSEQARGAARDRLDEIERLYNSIKPPDYDLSITDPPKLHEEALRRPEFSSAVAAPKFNLEKLSPRELKLVGQMVPEVAPYIEEAAPQVLQKTQDMKTGREAQLAALKRLMSIGSGEFDPSLAQEQMAAQRRAEAEAEARSQSLLQDFARRGQGGSGLSFAAQMGGNAQAMDRLAQANMSAASDAYRNRLQALAQGAQLGSAIGAEDTSFQARNADIINAFNDRLSRNRQAWEQQRAAALNNAQQYNLGVAQGLSNQNVENQNRYDLTNQQRLDNLARYNYENQVSERNRADDLAKWGYAQDVADRNYANQLAMSKASWQAGEKDKRNSLLNRQYQDELSRAGLKAGVSMQQSNNDISAAQDRNAAIQGLANAGMVYAQGQQARGDAVNSQLARDDRANYEKSGQWMTDDQMAARRRRYSDAGY